MIQWNIPIINISNCSLTGKLHFESSLYFFFSYLRIEASMKKSVRNVIVIRFDFVKLPWRGEFVVGVLNKNA